MADSAEVWGGFHRRRLEAAMKIKPDTMFVDRDQELYLFLFKGISKENQEKYIDQLLDNQKKADKENQKEEARKQKELEKEEKKKVKGQKKQKKSKDKDTIDNVVPIIEPVEKIDSVGIDKTEIVPPKEVETNDSTAISQQLVISCLIERKKNRI
jgi:hypothetical protein